MQKSGLIIGGRMALQQMVADVEAGVAEFSVILIYDVPGWGGQDADESAYYEYLCRKAGMQVAYCAEQFENAGSPASTIVKSLKRAMAGEYSRELPVKLFTGKCRLIELGHRQDGPADFGLHSALLNERGILTDLGRLWTRATVHQILSNEKYIGNNVYNRRSFKLKRKTGRQRPGDVDPFGRRLRCHRRAKQFQKAQAIIAARNCRFLDEEMLERLTRLFQRHGYISGLVIDEADGMPSSGAYAHRFGSLLRAYALVRITPDRDDSDIEARGCLSAGLRSGADGGLCCTWRNPHPGHRRGRERSRTTSA